MTSLSKMENCDLEVFPARGFNKISGWCNCVLCHLRIKGTHVHRHLRKAHGSCYLVCNNYDIGLNKNLNVIVVSNVTKNKRTTRSVG
jgi:hypothetical protein